jgi:hypothetical protein
MSSILRKVKSLPTLIKKRKSIQKLEKLSDSTPLPYERSPSLPRNWLFLERCQLLERLVDYFITLHGQDEENSRGKVWYWANDIDEEYPMTYRLDNDSTVSDSLQWDLGLDSTPTAPLTNDQQAMN